jgi:hypothetical protein
MPARLTIIYYFGVPARFIYKRCVSYKNKSMRLIFMITAIILCSCGGLGTDELKIELGNNKAVFESIAQSFLKQKNIEWISIYSHYDSSSCQSINRWSNCPSQGRKWESWDDSLKVKIYLNSMDEVLEKNNIKPADYEFYFGFLIKHNLGQISRVFDCGNCVEFESKLNGLRYVTNKGELLKEDDEYLKVERVDDNWFVYARDWN